jgi:hypothetical protein
MNVGRCLNSSKRTINMQPGPGQCYDYFENGYLAKKFTWLIPHIIKNNEDSEIITWHCNWGNSCESACLYAVNKPKVVTKI